MVLPRVFPLPFPSLRTDPVSVPSRTAEPAERDTGQLRLKVADLQVAEPGLDLPAFGEDGLRVLLPESDGHSP
jgi:hypothetical protein